MPRPGMIVWAFVGLKEIGLLIVVTLAMYGRSGLWKSPYLRLLRPWSDAPKRPAPTVRVRPGAETPTPPEPAPTRRDDRLFWFLTVLAAAAVAAWIVTRTLIVSGSGMPPRG